MRGVDAQTGAALAGVDHLRQSVRDVLATPIGGRVMRPAYGSRLLALVDAPMSPAWAARARAAALEALDRWEPRLRVDSVDARRESDGHATIEVAGEYLPDGQPVLIGVAL